MDLQFYTLDPHPNFQFSLQNLLEKLSPNNSTVMLKIELVKEIDIETPPEVIEPEIINEVTPTIEQHKYYIIAGAFAQQKNANKMLAKLNRWNYNAEMVEGGKLLRVSYDSFNNREDAILALNKIKQANPDAWLLTK